MRVRKDERPVIEQLLSTEADMDAMIEAVYSAVAGLVLARDWYVAAAKFGPVTCLYGPYSSTSEATKAMEKLVAPNEGAFYQIRKMNKTRDGQ